MHKIHYATKMFRPGTAYLPEKSSITCKSQRLLIYTGLIHGSARGAFLISPILLRSLEKLISLVDESMSRIDAEKVVMPSLGDGKLWKQSGRWKEMGKEMFRLKDRQEDDICLSPTNEEEVTNYVASSGKISLRNLPIKLYQITTKFRDEAQPKYGLLRSREFLMKDLYTFDADRHGARETYEAVCESYEWLLNQLKLRFVKVEGMTGLIGGDFSHEFHIPGTIGEDEVLVCDKCGHGRNAEMLEEDPQGRSIICPKCVDDSHLHHHRAIEIGHCFLLGHRYSECFKAMVEGQDKIRRPMEMGCYGIGVSRLLAASLEVLSEEEELRWPLALAPFRVGVVLQKSGAKDSLSKEDSASLITSLSRALPHGDLLVDDRHNRTIGRKLVDLKRLGIPYLVIGKKTDVCGEFELIDVNHGLSSTKNLDDIVTILDDVQLPK